MTRFHVVVFGIAAAAAATLGSERVMRGAAPAPAPTQKNAALTDEVPRFEVDPSWPKPLPHNWAYGNIGGVAVDSKDHIWVLHRPGMAVPEDNFAALDPPAGECCMPAPPVLEFDAAGNLVQSWGAIHDQKGVLMNKQVWGPMSEVQWPTYEHGIFVDHKDNVWIDNSNPPSQILKFNRDGSKYLLRIGQAESKSSNDTTNLAGAAGIWVDAKANELYVADGYRNRRVAVFDAETGAYKRHWGAYGKQPPDGPGGSNPIEGKYNPDGPRSQQFATLHCITISKDDLVYACDRVNDRIQVFKKDGTFVMEEVVAPRTLAFGSVGGIAFSADPDQKFLYVADGVNKKIWIVRRKDLKAVGSFAQGGHHAGGLAIAHAIATDSKGNVYVGESRGGDRVQRFLYKGMKKATS